MGHGTGIGFISVCTGGGGLDLGFELAVPGSRAVCMVEREAFAASRLVDAMQTGLMAPAPVWSDARTFAGRRWRGAVDGIIGGIPCQPHSVAGRKRGSLDERDLWSPFRRAFVQSGAWFCLVENVTGMLIAGQDEIPGAWRVVRDLERLGCVVAGGLFSAEEVGAPHARERVFILGVHDGRFSDAFGGGYGRRPQEPEREPQRGTAAERDRGELGNAEGVLGREVERYEPDGTGAGLFPPGPGDRGAWAAIANRAPHLEPAVRRVADGMADRVDRLRMLGNGVVPLAAGYAVRTIAARLAARGSAGAARLVRDDR